jgi:acylphosphatase
MTVARLLRIHGRVQGVFYRAWAVGTARELGLVGWVRNRRDGTVEAVVQSDEHAVQRFIAEAEKGPPRASVDRVEVGDAEPDAALTAFRQERSV